MFTMAFLMTVPEQFVTVTLRVPEVSVQEGNLNDPMRVRQFVPVAA
jgi:hypothetical protein